MDDKVGGYVSQYYRDYPPFGENGKEFLQEEYIVKDRGITELSESLGMPAEALSYFLRKYEFPMKNK
jgi:hypothetical protein